MNNITIRSSYLRNYSNDKENDSILFNFDFKIVHNSLINFFFYPLDKESLIYPK